jgi:tetratricopeptide (TPR) repeat protein
VSRPRGAPWTRGPLPMAIGGGFLGVAILLAAAAGTGNWDRVTGLFDRSTPSNAAQIALVDEQRVTALEMAVQLDPANVQALFELGEIYVQAEAWSDVIHWHNRVLEVDPTNTHSLNDVALASVYLGRYEEGLAYWDRALELEPNNPVLHYSLAFSLLNSPPYDWIRAREHFQRVIDLDPQSESAQSARSHVQAINSSLDAGDLEAEGATP